MTSHVAQCLGGSVPGGGAGGSFLGCALTPRSTVSLGSRVPLGLPLMCAVDTTPFGPMSPIRRTQHLYPPGPSYPGLLPPLSVPPRDSMMQPGPPHPRYRPLA